MVIYTNVSMGKSRGNTVLSGWSRCGFETNRASVLYVEERSNYYSYEFVKEY